MTSIDSYVTVKIAIQFMHMDHNIRIVFFCHACVNETMKYFFDTIALWISYISL